MDALKQFFAKYGTVFKRGLYTVVAFLLFVPYMAYQNMKERKAKEQAAKYEAHVLDPQTPGLKLTLAKDLDLITYVDGTQLPREGYGVFVFNQVEWEKNKSLASESVDVKLADFPIVVFVNASGFDATGRIVSIRRAKNGSAVFQSKDWKPLVRAVIPLRDGTYQLHMADSVATVSESVWFEEYMGLTTEPPPEPPKQNIPPSLRDLPRDKK